ncbi:haloacid dehalogenase [Blastopirellula marina]|uniref:Haloacid dehalogenase n=1 Tax=Blastopirellula marina TaxID=124 RepID=A0A2S8F163_9BACT|nr:MULTISPECIES: HAD hydrolase-like protein [Pirellulaceae]PQO25901.1 haloacid dehalogenase [Blastopirellula marina]RCS44259.1 HAD family hydrolase [Bremerella cremea]
MVYQIEPKQEFLVGIDSDGCVFDTMELKHKECFIPNIINYYELQGVSKYAREAAEFVNLYSKSRGINRFPALVETLEWLQKRPEVIERGAKIEIPASLTKWIAEETKLGNPALEAKVAESNDPDLAHCLKWSKAVNETVAGMVRGVAPFPSVRKCLEKLTGKADMLVVSATPNDALNDEWEEHDIRQFVTEICGQEAGNKKETLTNATKYKPNQTLMIGDAPGDYKAAVANDCLFYPINPGDEENSWKRFYDEGIDKFLNLEFAGDYQKALLEEFDRYLPEKPSWPVVG